MAESTSDQHKPALEAQTDGDTLRLTLTGRLDSASVASLWKVAADLLDTSHPLHVVVDAGGVSYCDGAGAALLVELARRQRGGQRSFEVHGLSEEFAHLVAMLDPGPDAPAKAKRSIARTVVESIGRETVVACVDLLGMITFVGELTIALAHAAAHPRRIRWKDAFLIAEAAGVNAVGIVVLIGFLTGLIIAFQSAIPLRRLAAEIYVADLVSMGLLRELGPLMTAIILAGRTGSAFAAELGTMKVNEELDALTTMGLDPVRFLVTTRVMAATAVMPLLTLFANVAGLVGCGVVMSTLGFPLSTYLDQIRAAVGVGDLMGGLLKSAVFGFLIGSVGCLRGLQTGAGASAVGASATRAVVSGILLIVIADGLFAAVFHVLGV